MSIFGTTQKLISTNLGHIGIYELVHYDIIYTTNGLILEQCSSAAVLSLLILPTYNERESALLCPGDSYTFPDGTIQTNITFQVIQTSNLNTIIGACDSIIVTTINVESIGFVR
ncbi:MAG: hypothetical protein ACI94Y_003382 [Maribacter sp.]|jgi:hypothetical protein